MSNTELFDISVETFEFTTFVQRILGPEYCRRATSSSSASRGRSPRELLRRRQLHRQLRPVRNFQRVDTPDLDEFATEARFSVEAVEDAAFRGEQYDQVWRGLIERPRTATPSSERTSRRCQPTTSELYLNTFSGGILPYGLHDPTDEHVAISRKEQCEAADGRRGRVAATYRSVRRYGHVRPHQLDTRRPGSHLGRAERRRGGHRGRPREIRPRPTAVHQVRQVRRGRRHGRLRDEHPLRGVAVRRKSWSGSPKPSRWGSRCAVASRSPSPTGLYAAASGTPARPRARVLAGRHQHAELLAGRDAHPRARGRLDLWTVLAPVRPPLSPEMRWFSSSRRHHRDASSATLMRVMRRDGSTNSDRLRPRDAGEGAPGDAGPLKHALRNTLTPVTTITAIPDRELVGGAVVVETVFSYPGLGMPSSTQRRPRFALLGRLRCSPGDGHPGQRARRHCVRAVRPTNRCFRPHGPRGRRSRRVRRRRALEGNSSTRRRPVPEIVPPVPRRRESVTTGARCSGSILLP